MFSPRIQRPQLIELALLTRQIGKCGIRTSSKAVGYDMWNYIQGIEELASNHERPTYANYAIKRTAATARPTRTQSVIETQDTIEERSAETVSEERPTPQASEASREVSTKSLRFGDLTAEGQKTYQAAWSFYQDDMKIYRE